MTPMEKELISALAKIDDALGMPQDGCNELDATMTAIELLHAVIKDNEITINSMEVKIAELEAQLADARKDSLKCPVCDLTKPCSNQNRRPTHERH